MNIIERLRNKKNKLYASWKVYGSKGTFSYPVSVIFEVPVVPNGEGTVEVGEHVNLGYNKAPKVGGGDITLQAREANAVIKIGAHTKFSNNINIVAASLVSIGQHCLIGDFVNIVDSDFHDLDPELRHLTSGETKPVYLEDNVWLGSRVMILKGCRVGRNSVVAAGSIVTRDVPENVVVAGIPAKVVKSLDKE